MDKTTNAYSGSPATNLGSFDSAAEALMCDIQPADMEACVARLRKQSRYSMHLPVCEIDDDFWNQIGPGH